MPGDDDRFRRRARGQSRGSTNVRRRRTKARATPTPMPAFAPVLRPRVFAAVAEGGGSVGADVAAVGVEVRECEDEDEDVVAAGIEVDHVVAGRTDLGVVLWFSGCLLHVVRCLANSGSVGRRRTAR